MIKRVWFFIFIGLFFMTASSYGLDYQGYSIPPEIIKNLPQDARDNLPADIDTARNNLPTKIDTGREDTTTQVDESFETEKDEKDIQKAIKPSIVEAQYRNGYSSLLGKKLTQFGYDIFNSAKLKSSSLAIPDSSYVLGTGDELLIRVWGTGVDAEYPTTINREGTINVPKIGVIQLSGVKYGDIDSIIKREAEKYIQGINISVVLVKLKSLEVYIVGAVNNPGLHMVPSFSTIFDGLIVAGGIQKSGTLRKIKLFRGKEQIETFDLYDLLLNGNRESDRILQNKDVLFVPGIGKTAAVAGATNHEGIFELGKKNSVKDLVEMSGGLLPQAFGSRIYLRRFNKNKEFVVQDIDSNTPEEWRKIYVQNGDMIELQFSNVLVPSVVYLEGNVWTPDIFQYKPGMTLSQVLVARKILKPGALMDFGLIYRYDTKTTRTRPVRFPLSKVFNKTYDTELQPLDRIVVLSRDAIGIEETFQIRGAVWNTGQYKYQPGLRLEDALALAGGLKFGAGTTRVEVARQKIKDNLIETEYVLLDLAKDGGFVLEPNDSILIPTIKDASLVRKITLTGEVKYPGTYTLRENEKVSDLISRAGGFTDNAYFYGAKYTSESARKIQQQGVDKMIEKLELSQIQSSSELAQTATSLEDAKSAEASNAAIQGLLEKLRSLRAEGRVAIKLADLASFKNTMYDFSLQDGDALYIPEKPAFVSVVGSVYSPGSFLYEPDRTLDFYLEKSGGTAKTADKKHVYLYKANGEIVSISQKQGFFKKFGDTILMPGDSIVVPENLDRIPYLKFIGQISDIIFKIATTAGIAFAI